MYIGSATWVKCSLFLYHFGEKAMALSPQPQPQVLWHSSQHSWGAHELETKVKGLASRVLQDPSNTKAVVHLDWLVLSFHPNDYIF